MFGERPERSFREAATRYLNEYQDKRSIGDDALHVRQLDSHIGDLALKSVHMGTLQPFIKHRQQLGTKTKSINLSLGVVRHLLNIATSEWLDNSGLTWLEHPPRIKLLKVADARKPYPMSWDEQATLIQELPKHLARMALFRVDTGVGSRKCVRFAGTGRLKCRNSTRQLS